MSDQTASIKDYIADMAARARNASREMATRPSASKVAALRLAADKIRARAPEILAINAEDVANAKANGTRASFVDRMLLDEARIEGICSALEEIAAQDDPVGEVIQSWARPNGLEISRVRVPLGVIAVIYESRPNVTIDAAAIALMAGNAAILRGGSECIRTAKALFDCFSAALEASGLPVDAAQFVETTDRAAVGEILAGGAGNIDLVIPRGGKSLVGRVQQEARVPVLSHLDGICHVYVDRDADYQKAVDVVVNAKMRRVGICGAAETLLIDQACAQEFWPQVASALRARDCELRGDDAICALDDAVAKADEEDWTTEYLAPILSVAVVDGVEGALDHIARYSSAHTEAILTENQDTAERFLAGVDSAIVMHNASTQYADGGEFGLGAEIGIATGRLHVRGPVGVRELTTFKNIVRGTGQARP